MDILRGHVTCPIFERPFVKRIALCYRTVVLSVCTVCSVGVLWPNGWMDQDATWYRDRPQPRPQCVRWGPSSHTEKGHSSLMRFPPYFYFRYSSVVYRSFCNLLHQISRLSAVTVAFDVNRCPSMLFPVLPKPEVVLTAIQLQIGPYIVLKTNRKSSTASSCMWFPPYFYFRFRRRH